MAQVGQAVQGREQPVCGILPDVIGRETFEALQRSQSVLAPGFWRSLILISSNRSAGPVNVRETAGFCIYCSDPALLRRGSPTALALGCGS
jgi:hypothetical protein